MKRKVKVIPSKEFSREPGFTLVHGVRISDQQIEDLEGKHGGKLVRDVFLSDSLNKLAKGYNAEHGVFPDLLRPPEFPTEEFASHRIDINVPVFGAGKLPTKWHAFFRRPKVFVVA